MLDHVGIQGASASFYDAVLAPLGVTRLMDFGVAMGRAGFSRDGRQLGQLPPQRKPALAGVIPVVEPGVDPGTFRFSGGRSAD